MTFLPAALDRRAFLRNVALGGGGLLASPLAQPLAQADRASSRPRRIVFFLQNQGLNPIHCRPLGISINEKSLDRIEDASLLGHKLPDHIAPLAAYQDRLTIVQGINGKHVVPYHGAGYGALGGVRRSHSEPNGETIDCALAKALPALFPLLGLAWTSLPGMQNMPIRYCSSAWERNQAAPLYANPLLAHAELFGAGVAGAARDRFDADTELLDLVKTDVARTHKRLADAERDKFQPYLDGYEVMGQRRRQLMAMADRLRQHAPELTKQFTAPRFDTDWFEASLEVAAAALIAGLTNVVTVTSGLCHANNGSWAGIGGPVMGHGFGHSGADAPIWCTVHSYNMKQIIKLMQKLEAVPEGQGTMLDNTLIVYTSCHSDVQHSHGERWPFVLIGNLGGRIRTGRFIHYPIMPQPKGRSINALYASLLHAAGAPRDYFNLTGPLKEMDRPGPLPELLA